MKTVLSVFLLVVFTIRVLPGQNATNSVTDVLLSAYSERSYTNVPVTDQQLDIILRCGIKAPSGMNRQPWKFTVIRDEATMKEAVKDVVAGNVLIVISGTDNPDGSAPDLFGCGLATQNMFIAAHGLGLGARIYGGPVAGVNTRRDLFEIPQGYKTVMILRVGNVERNSDASSGASPRKGFDGVVNFKK